MKSLGNVVLILFVALIVLGALGTEHVHKLNELKQVREEIVAAREENAKLRTNNDGYKKDNQLLQEENETLQNKTQSLEEKNIILTNEIYRKDQEYEELKEQLEPAQKNTERENTETIAYPVHTSQATSQKQPLLDQYPSYLIGIVVALFFVPLVREKLTLTADKATEKWSPKRKEQEINRAKKHEQDMRKMMLRNKG
jgi:hypothetical protein